MNYILRLLIIINTLRVSSSFTFIHPESFIGSWELKDNTDDRIIHLSKSGSIYKSSEKNYKHIGNWEINKKNFIFVLNDNNIEKLYDGYIYANSLNIYGNVCEGLFSPCFTSEFSLLPLFEQFHNISYITYQDPFTYLNPNTVLGKWVLENLTTNQIYILELFQNNTWNSLEPKDAYRLNGRWNLFNETDEININSAISKTGTNIWICLKNGKNQPYINYDLVFIGKITKLGNSYYFNDDQPSSSNTEETNIISSKINGSVCYGFDLEPEMSEKFYMKRWFD